MLHEVTFTNLHQYTPEQLVAVRDLLDACIGVRVTNPDATVTVELKLAESGVVLRGVPALYTNNDLEVFLPCCDGVLRVPLGQLLRLQVEVEG